MELSLWVMVVIAIVLIVLIVKFVKKVIFMILGIVVIFFLIYFGAVALVVADVENLGSERDLTFDVIYIEDDNYVFGARVPVRDGNLTIEEFSGISKDELDKLDVVDITEEDDKFVILIDSKLYEDALADVDYSLDKFAGDDLNEYDLTLTREDILTIVENDMSVEDLAKTLMPDEESDILETLLEMKLDEHQTTPREIAFAFSLDKSFKSSTNSIKFIDGYKNDEIEVYPNRLTFKLLKWLPDSNIKGLIDDEDEDSENQE